MSWNGYEHNVLLRNLGTDANGVPQYVDVAMGLGADGILDARGIAVVDYDNDGDLDIAINHNPGDNDRESVPVTLLNNGVATGNWLTVALEGRASNRDAVGARVVRAFGEERAVRRVGGSSYASQHDRRLHFGLGDHTRVDRLSVHWPSGLVEHYENLSTGQRIRLIEGEGLVRPDRVIGGAR